MQKILLNTKKRSIPVALTIAGSDSGGGAGIQADLKTFAALGVHGTSVVTCLTAQNSKRILAIEPCSPRMVRKQLEAVFEERPPQAIKIGMLYNAENIRAVVAFLESRHERLPLVVDPVATATSGRRLLQPKAVKLFLERLVPRATLLTPNLPEAEWLTGHAIREPEEMREAARFIHKKYGCAVLVKGGHLQDAREAIDIFYDGRNELLLSAPFVPGLALHGTGCTYSAAITAFLARGCGLPEAVERGKAYITRAIGHR
jgi:hydroxymethylpyrimidine/phosphomethylpyrimidine kinase